MAILIRQARTADYPSVYALVEATFADMPESDHKEQDLVERLRLSEAFVPPLSIVAETDKGQIVGYVLLTKVEIVSDGRATTSLAVAPLAVLPAFQRQGIGGRLLREAHTRAAELGYRTAVLIGHKDYYPRFGYRQARDWGIAFPFDIPAECGMLIELCPRGAEGIQGMVRYPKEFMVGNDSE